jgi:uroporphyrinogen decarboxylase
MLNAFEAAIQGENEGRPPVWFMRQAGRYHSHYQALKAKHSFIELCKNPALACEVTMGPIRDFGFDAAILFSDLLFPLEAMGMGLSYDPGPKLGWNLKTRRDLDRLKGGAALAGELAFQGEALRLLQQKLDPSKGLIGFVGGPLTLYCYAAEGGHAGELQDARMGFEDGRYQGFVERLHDLLVANMGLQARSGAQAVAVFDTSAGEFSAAEYAKYGVPALRRVFADFRDRLPGTPIIYYSRGTGPEQWRELEDSGVSCLGVDWRHDLAEVLKNWSPKFAVQGNIDPEWLHLPARELESQLRIVFKKVLMLPKATRRGWICGLGHGVLQRTPEENVRLFLRIQKEMFGEAKAKG